MLKLVRWLLDLLYPNKCTFCHKLCTERVCLECKISLPYAPIGAQLQSFRGISACVSPFYYEGNVRESLLRYKFDGVSMYSPVYAKYVAKCIRENDLCYDVITWAPLSRARLRKRGYDQARLIAEEVSKLSGVPCERLLRKQRNNPAQSGTGSAEKRKANVSGVYAVAKGADISGRRVLIIDDIITSGATVSECARILKQGGAKKVLAASVARGRRD